MDIIYRVATTKDILSIQMLLYEIFGSVYRNDDINARIQSTYVAELDNNIIATTGYVSKTDFNDYEISWTVVDKKYRHLGIMFKLMGYFFIQTSDLNMKYSYLSAWRFSHEDKPNLHNIIDKYNFKLCMKEYKSYNKEYFKYCELCSFNAKCVGHCYEDLYRKEF